MIKAVFAALNSLKIELKMVMSRFLYCGHGHGTRFQEGKKQMKAIGT